MKLRKSTFSAGLAAAALLASMGPALADSDEHHGGKNCVNPAGNVRGWCKNGDNDDRQGRKHHRRGHRTSISGTVVSMNGNVAQFRLDNGQVVTVLDNNGTVLSVGQHYTLNGSYLNGQFVLGSNGSGNTNMGQSVSGNIVAVGNGTVTLLGVPPLVINVQQAINANATNGALSVGRHITAYGYYSGNVFYATSIQ